MESAMGSSGMRHLLARLESSRVGCNVDLAQVLFGHQRVDLGGRDARVTEKLLHHANVGTTFEQMRGERVPKRVERDATSKPRALRVLRKEHRAPLSREPSASVIQEQRAAASKRGEGGPSAGEVRPHRVSPQAPE